MLIRSANAIKLNILQENIENSKVADEYFKLQGAGSYNVDNSNDLLNIHLNKIAITNVGNIEYDLFGKGYVRIAFATKKDGRPVHIRYSNEVQIIQQTIAKQGTVYFENIDFYMPCLKGDEKNYGINLNKFDVKDSKYWIELIIGHHAVYDSNKILIQQETYKRFPLKDI